MSRQVKRKFQEIGTGDPAVDRTIENMIRLARRDAKDPRIVALARGFGGDDVAQLRATFDHVVDTIEYVKDPPDRELVKAPVHTLVGDDPTGDCDDLALALAALALAQGRRVWFVTIAWRKQAFTHVYTFVELPSKKIAIPCDPVMGKDGFGAHPKTKRQVKRQKIYGA